MSSSIHGLTLQAIGMTDVPSKAHTPCSVIHKTSAAVVDIDCGDQGVQESESST